MSSDELKLGCDGPASDLAGKEGGVGGGGSRNISSPFPDKVRSDESFGSYADLTLHGIQQLRFSKCGLQCLQMILFCQLFSSDTCRVP